MPLRGTAFHPRHPQPRPESPGTRLYVTPEADVGLVCRYALKRFLESKMPAPSASIQTVSELVKAWQALEKVKVLDPGCGEGHFLLGMLRALAEAKSAFCRQMLDHRETSVGEIERDGDVCNDRDLVKRQILARNLYGVEVDARRVERTRSLLERDANRLEHYPGTRRQLVRGDAFSLGEGATTWPEVGDQGGFDIVIGNPPFVRHELIEDPLGSALPGQYKRGLERSVHRRFPTIFGWDEKRNAAIRPLDRRSDLAALFTLLGLSLTRPGGILAFVLPTALLQARYGQQLREVLEQEAEVSVWERFEERSFNAGVNTIALFAVKRTSASGNSAQPLDRTAAVKSRVPPRSLAIDLLSKISGTTTLGALGRLRYSVKTGINEFFYPGRQTIERFQIESQYLKPVLRSPRSVKRISVDENDISSFLFHCSEGTDALEDQGSHGALAYIRWGARQATRGGVKWPFAPSVSSRLHWYSVTLPEPAQVICPRFLDRRFFFLRPTSSLVEDQTFYGLVLVEQNRWLRDFLGAILNSSIVYLLLETFGRTGLGEGVRQYALCDFSSLAIPDPRVPAKGFIREVNACFEPLAKRPILPIDEEIQQEDRHGLDGLVARAFGLSGKDMELARKAVRDLTLMRLQKARKILER
jgi:hypothetical protein